MEAKPTAFLKPGCTIEDPVTAEAVQLLVMAFPMISANVDASALDHPKDYFPGLVRDHVHLFLVRLGVDEKHLQI